MKKIFLLCLLLSTLGCSIHYIEHISPHEVTSEDLEFLKSKKIGLIGFYPFVTQTKSVMADDILNINLEIKNPRYLRIIEFVNDNPKGKVFVDLKEDSFLSFHHHRYGISQSDTKLDNNENLIQFLDFGKRPNQLKLVNKNTSVSQERLREFLTIYLENTKNLGLAEVDNLLVIPDKKEQPIQMKNFDVDYWVIGIFQKKYYENTNEKANITFIPSLLTYGTIPYWDEKEVRSTFIVFDKQLNQIQKFETTSTHEYIAAWWISTLENPYSSLFLPPSGTFHKPNMQQFSKELVQVLKK